MFFFFFSLGLKKNLVRFQKRNQTIRCMVMDTDDTVKEWNQTAFEQNTKSETNVNGKNTYLNGRERNC